MKGLILMFVVFEGIDFSGKTTQIDLLEKNCDKKFIRTKEPGSTKLGKRVREILLDEFNLSKRVELTLFMADRLDHIEKFIEPEIKAGNNVVSDRYWYSTYAYQNEGLLKSTTLYFVQMFQMPNPDIVFYLDIDPKSNIYKERMLASGRELDNFENGRINELSSIRNNYLGLAKHYNMIVIDASKSQEEVHMDIMNWLNINKEGEII